MIVTNTSPGTVTVFDATTGGPDATTGPLDVILIQSDGTSATGFSVLVQDFSGDMRYASGREPSIGPGGTIPLTWPEHKIGKVQIIFTGAATAYVAPYK